ncbi:C5a anaphylatoxin chemotactic receptor 1 [Megalops cyprinoides]|uniref:C5a anaphylatoxin chemotactic receptor 1 n=1 Tax=Megalops cyprinoides TaxID=118141 RepID=UPI001864F355|nr:C5a anaphylatoxin chemotactic receptor 1 [Megalops cyprinoides]
MAHRATSGWALALNTTPTPLGIQPNATGSFTEVSRVTQMVVTVLIFLVGIPLNALVVWILGVRGGRRNGRAREEARGASSFRVYVVNLALADLVLVLRTPLMLGYLADGGSWPFGLGACRLVMFLRGLGLYANAFLLCAISLERCLCLLRPVWFRLRRPRWTVPLICAVLWVLAASLSTPYISTATLFVLNNRNQCWESAKPVQTLFIMETTMGFLLPLLLFLSSNLVVLLTARLAGGAVPGGGSGAPCTTSLRLVRLYRVLFLTMLLFLTCWVPYFTCRFLKALADVRPSSKHLYMPALTGMYVSLYLVYVKSALNPTLYVFAARGLSRTVRASFFSAVDRIFNDDTSDYARRKSLRRTDSQF